MGVLDGCGSHSDRLNEIAKTMYAQRIKNGEPVSNSEKANIDTEIFAGYQAILSVARNGEEISEAVNELHRKVSSGQVLNNFSGTAAEVANNVVQKNIETQEYMENTLKTFGTMAAVTTGVGAIVVGAELINKIPAGEHFEKIDNLYEDAFQWDEGEFEESYKAAQNGDEKACAELAVYRQAVNFMGTHPILSGHLDRAAVAYMANLYAIGTSKTLKMIERMAEQYKIDVLSIDESGETVIDKSKIESECEARIGKKGKEHFERARETVISIGQRARERGEFSEKEPTIAVEGWKSGTKKTTVTARINAALKTNNLEELQALFEAEPEKMREVLRMRVESYNKLVSRNSPKAAECFEKIQILDSIVVKRKEEQTIEGSFKASDNKPPTTEISDEREI